MLEQIEESRDRLKDHVRNNDEVQEKIYTQRETISQRELEIDELKNKIT